jgi:hypothetical protein
LSDWLLGWARGATQNYSYKCQAGNQAKGTHAPRPMKAVHEYNSANMNELLQDLLHEFRRHKTLADRAMGQLSDEEFFRRPAAHVNPVALIVKHLAGNLHSRWSDFLTTDGEKPTRDRDQEFVVGEGDTRTNLLEAWERGWQTLFNTVAGLDAADLSKSITIRGESHTVCQALVRGLTHAAYHVGQILYLVRLLRPDSAWLTIAPGQSRVWRDKYLKR